MGATPSARGRRHVECVPEPKIAMSFRPSNGGGSGSAPCQTRRCDPAHPAFRIWPLAEMLTEVFPALSTTMASSQLGRTLQLIKASGWRSRT